MRPPISPRRRSATRWLPAVVIGGSSWALAATYALEAKNWAVMTDELQVERLAISVGETLSPLPTIHGEYYAALSQLYPIVIAPLYALLSAPDAFATAHALNALLWASSAWPAYLLARAVTGASWAGYLAGAMTAFTPWLVLSATLLTENAAYPACVWAVFLAHRSITRPGAAADLVALAGLVVAFLARTQLFVVALALPLAVVGHEVGYALSRAERGGRLRAVESAFVRSIATHRVLAAAYALGAGAAAILALAGSLGSVVGNYADTFSTPLFPPGLGDAAAVHLVRVAVAVGVVPFVVGVAWSLVTLARPQAREEHAFAALFAPLVLLLIFEAASFNLRFTPGAFVQDRYLVYLAPLLAVACAAGLASTQRRTLLAALTVAASLAFLWLAGFESFDPERVIFWASPAAAFHPALEAVADSLGVAPATLVRAGGALVGVGVAAAQWRAPVLPTACAAGAAVAAFGAVQAVYVFERAAVPATQRPSTIVTPDRDWVDAAVPGGSSVVLIPNPYLGPGIWWDVEFWNKTVARVLRVDGAPTYTPFPADEVAFDFAAGTFRGRPVGDLHVVAINETRFHLRGSREVARVPPLRLVRVKEPFEADWATSGADADGWTRPGGPVTVRLYGLAPAEAREVAVTLSAPAQAQAAVAYSLTTAGENTTGATAPGTYSRAGIRVCVGAEGAADVTLVTRAAARLPDGRLVGLHLDAVEVSRESPCP